MNAFVKNIYEELVQGTKHSKRSVEKIALRCGISDPTRVKEYTELAIVHRARELAAAQPLLLSYQRMVALYYAQVNLSYRTSQSVLLQQYSTPAPISFLAGCFVKSGQPKSAAYLEPSAGNGLLTVALPEQQVTVNEVDDIRLENLRAQRFARVTNQDATEPFFGYEKKFDGVLTNPPFGALPEAVYYGRYPIKTLDHLMALRALDCMKDKGSAAIIIGGHTEWDGNGRIKAGKNRIFFSCLHEHYRVVDAVNISGELYRRQGTTFNVRLILVAGRKEKPSGYAPLKTAADTEVKDFDALFERISPHLAAGSGGGREQRLRIAKVKAIALRKKLALLKLGHQGQLRP
jgi:hypothetical protein